MKTLAGKGIKARFVGGPKHNEVIECEGSPIAVVAGQQSFKAMLRATDDLIEDTLKLSHYRLLRFVSEGGARWSQYVHESLLVSGEPDRRTYAPPGPVHLCAELADCWFTMQMRSLELLECRWRCK